MQNVIKHFTVQPVQLWAVIVRNPRTEWINRNTIRRTRKEAWAAYCEGWNPGVPKQHKRKKQVRVARVTVSTP